MTQVNDYLVVREQIFEKFVAKFGNTLPHTHGYFIAGGVFPRLFCDLPIRDIDLFAENNDHYNRIQEILFHVDGLEFLEDDSHPNLCKFQHEDGYQIDLVNAPKRTQRSATELLQQFDFTISRIYVAHHVGFNIQALDNHDFVDVAERKLKFTGKILFGTKRNNTLTRLLKYTKLGYKITEQEYVEIGEAIHVLLQKAIDAGAIDPKEIGGNKYY